MSLVQALAFELNEDDELIVAIDMADACRARDLRNELHHRRVDAKVVGYGYPTMQHADASPPIRKLAGRMRSRFYASLQPDVLLICSLFETGTPHSTELDWSILGNIPTAVVGYDLIPLLFPDRYLLEGYFVTDWYRARLDDLLRFDLILSISEATKRDLIEHLGIPEERIVVIGAGFDERLVCPYGKQEGDRRLQELGIMRPFVLTVGNGDWRKNTLGALKAFAELPEDLRNAHDLVLTQAGEDVEQALEQEHASLRGHVRVLGRVDDATLALLYRECRVLYFPSHYEGFGLPVLEAMALGAPVVSSNAGALPEVVHAPGFQFDPDSLREGVALLSRILTDEAFREKVRHGAREHALMFTWTKTARKAAEALHGLGLRGTRAYDAVAAAGSWPDQQDIELMADACMEAERSGERALEDGLRAIASRGRRRVLVDITEIKRLDAKTGIQRVTRKFLAGLLAIARASGTFEVEPFCWTDHGIVYAREFARDRLGLTCAGPDTPVRVQPSDLVFMLDSSWWLPERFDELHARVHAAGGEVVWMVYDLIPIRFPETCDPDVLPAFRTWLVHAIRTADGFVCISEATRNDLESFMDGVIDAGGRRPWTRSVHLGCDMEPAHEDSPSEACLAVRRAIGQRPYFMGLGTVEPRKDYGTIIDAFESLWARGVDVALVVAGKRGWNVDALAERINQSPEFNQRLFWLRGAGDIDVRHLLEGSAALIQASIWEGFGLPLIEASSLGIPLLVSDIAVFHEIAGDGATYFPVGDAAALTDAVILALDDNAPGDPASIRIRGWGEASADLAKILSLN
jgi:glycosyltransferase involved in cell wall biosynthesis